jgi:ABC-type sugar transport system substrate-binding protein
MRFTLSTTTNDNDYQIEQAAAARQSAQRLGVELELLHANNDAIEQSQQLLKVIQRPPDQRPDAIVFEPVGTPLPQAAQAAVAVGIGWVVLNREAGYITELRSHAKAPVFVLSSDHLEIGRVQGRQIAALLPNGGNVLCVLGAFGDASAHRTAGMMETKPAQVQVKTLRGNWTEESAQKSVASWLKLATSRKETIDLIAAQDDSMAMGARRAVEAQFTGPEREKWKALPFIGCDGLPKTGQTWVKTGLLAATVVLPPNAGLALEMLVHAMRSGEQPRELVFTPTSSLPTIEALQAKARK